MFVHCSKFILPSVSVADLFGWTARLPRLHIASFWEHALTGLNAKGATALSVA
jgi:hypothetical protein